MKKFLNTCIDCKTVTEKGTWIVTIQNGPLMIKERFNVGPEFGPDPEHFDLDVIDAKKLADKYSIKEEIVEEAILNGEVACPNCGSLNFFEYCENTDKQYLK